MSSVYFIADEGSVIALDAEESTTVSKRNAVSETSRMGGGQVADDYIEGNNKISITGKVTYSKSPSQQQQNNPDPLQFKTLLDSTIRSKTRFRLYYSKISQPLLQDIENCVISDYSISIDQYIDTITVSISLSEVFVSQAATVTFLPPVIKSTDKPGLGGANDGKVTKKQETEERSTLIYKAINVGGTDVSILGNESVGVTNGS